VFAIASALAGMPVAAAVPSLVGIELTAPPADQAQDAPVAQQVTPATQPTTPVLQVPSPPPPPAATGTPVQTELTDEVVVIGRDRRGDPLSAVNEESFKITQAVDDAVVAPTARAYKKNVPSPIRSGLRNFIGNLREPVAALNFLLQLKPGKAAETVGRFAVNTTIGAAGLFDVAKRKPFNLPRRRNSLANTLGYYGVKPGPFLFLPLIGPVTVRDLIGNIIDQVAIPVTSVPPLDNPAVTIPLLNLGALDFRAENDGTLEKLKSSRDPYGAVRRYYLARRQAEIDALRGKPTPAPLVSGYYLPPPETFDRPATVTPSPAATPVPPSAPRVIVIPPAAAPASPD
jgi:phospholipid-binding lipoprotein MlaA